jgi:hypothetical protein
VDPAWLVEVAGQLVDTEDRAELLGEHVKAVLNFILGDITVDDLTVQEAMGMCALLAPAHSRVLRGSASTAGSVLRLVTPIGSHSLGESLAPATD